MTIRHIEVAAAGLVLCVTLGCGQVKNEGRISNPNMITEDEIARARVRTAHDAVMKLAANFLTRRGETSVMNTSNPEPNVYLDDVFIGTVAQLKGIQASDVASIRLYRSWEATTRFGGGNMGGVIEVYTKH